MRAAGLTALVMVLSASLASAQVAPPVTDILAKGDAAYSSLKYGEAFNLYRKAADLGDARAEVRLGNMYALAMGVHEDQTQAMVWYRKAADQGDAGGEFYVGLQYESGWGVARDYGQALVWYLKSANHGNAVAAEAVGMIYENGLGVPADFKQARVWLDKAISGGDAAAVNGLCGPYEAAWITVAFGKDVAAMDRVISKIDPNCDYLLAHAKGRRDEVERISQTGNGLGEH